MLTCESVDHMDKRHDVDEGRHERLVFPDDEANWRSGSFRAATISC